MKYVITAVIPTVQYGNIQPSIEVEADTFEEANAQAMPHIEELWEQYADKPLNKKVSNLVKHTAFVGGEIYVSSNPLEHGYYWNGEKYLSGSEYANKFAKPFDSQAISSKMAEKWGVEASDIQAMWQLKNDVSKGFGTAMHAALELYGRFNGLAKSIEKNTHLHDHPTIKKAVESFYEGRENEKAKYEPLIVDHNAKRAGQVDRLLITGVNSCRIQDFKFNATMPEEKLAMYWEQLKFYAGIMMANGWIVDGLDIFHNDGTWHTFTKEAK